MTRKAYRPLADYRFLGAVVVLAVNDHYLKSEYGNWLTGKLSDFAGLIVLAVVISALATSASIKHAKLVVHGAVGVWFVAMKTLSTAAYLTEQLFQAITPFSSQILVDPMDLLGLFGLPISWFIINDPRPLFDSLMLKRIAFALACASCLATSSPEEPSTPNLLTDPESGQVVVVGRCRLDNQCESDSDSTDTMDLVDSESQEVCSNVDPSLCFRIRDGAIQESKAEGQWKTVWKADPSSSYTRMKIHYNLSSGSTLDVVELAQDEAGRLYAAVDNMSQVLVRSADGEWTPSAQSLRAGWWFVQLLTFYSAVAVLSIFSKTNTAIRLGICVASILMLIASHELANAGAGLIPGFVFVLPAIVGFIASVAVGLGAVRHLVSSHGLQKFGVAIALALLSGGLIAGPWFYWIVDLDASFSDVIPSTVIVFLFVVTLAITQSERYFPAGSAAMENQRAGRS